MGVSELGKLIPSSIRRVVDIKQLQGKTISVDAYNALYQFLASIRQPDGTPLMDSKGRITSHLSGLFYRTINLLEERVWPVYVFDGKPPELKLYEIARRRRQRDDALDMWMKAVERGDKEEARKYARRALFLTDDMVEDAKRLLTCMGVPWVQAPAEGEAQAAYMAKVGAVWAAASQDYDALLFGAPVLVRNITITGRRKVPGRNEYVEVKPEIIELNDVLKALRLRSREQLVDLAILLGTDYNPDGVPDVGPQRALRLIHEFQSLDKVLNVLRLTAQSADLIKIREYFLNPVVTDRFNISFGDVDEKGIIEILVYEHDFNRDRVLKGIERIKKAMSRRRDRTIDSFLT